MQTGTVRWFNPGKGYGFVHASEVERAGLGILSEGQTIGVGVEQGAHGKTSAVQLRRA